MSHGILHKGDQWLKYEKEQDKLRIGGGSWSINLDELPDEAETIVYVTEDYGYRISVMGAKLRGFVRVLGGEQKLVVPLKFWERKEVIK